MEKKTGAQIVIDFFRFYDIDLIFGYPGGAILPVYDELFKANISHVLVRHEQAAIHAAEGYAKSTGKLGVVLVTSGPGATNLVTGLVDAQMDSVPVLAITGQVPTYMMGKDSFQEVDVESITRDVIKFSRVVKDVNDLPLVLGNAYESSTSLRPGASLVDIPKDVQNLTIDGEYFFTKKSKKIFPAIKGDIDLLAEAINESERPLFYVGGGAIISGADELLMTLVTKANIPVVMTLMALGVFPSGHELSLGMMGMHGTFTANKAVMTCDLLIALGARFDDRVTGKISSFASQASIAHIDIDGSEIDKIISVDYPVCGDLADVLEKLIPLVFYRKRDEWFSALDLLKREHPLFYNSSQEVIKPQYFIQRLDELSCDDAIVVTEVGQHQMWAAQFYSYRYSRSWITSGGLGTMGFGFPAAIGVKFALPEKTVLLIAGDASFQMNQQELATCKVYGIDVKIIILNNFFLGMVRQWQDLFFDSRLAHTSCAVNPDFVKLAQAYGLRGMQIRKASEIDMGIDFLLDNKQTTILDVVIPEDEMVFPVVPSGASLDDIVEFDRGSFSSSSNDGL